jgi:putative Holliday junction resolvase
MKRLGIDFGSKKVGIALSDDGGTIAFPKTILKNDATLTTAIAELCRSEGVGEIVIGESLDLSGVANPIMTAIAAFAPAIATATGLPVVMQKEYMTSIEARRVPGARTDNIARKVKQADPGNVDASAAALILQRYLDMANRK